LISFSFAENGDNDNLRPSNLALDLKDGFVRT
jgi:hypothetical protein